jgi:hypothetical protein
MILHPSSLYGLEKLDVGQEVNAEKTKQPVICIARHQNAVQNRNMNKNDG